MITTKQKLYHVSLKICLRETKKDTLAGSHREDKSLFKYDDMKFPHCKIIDEHSAIHHHQMLRGKKKKEKQTHSGGWLPSCYFQLPM
jgi:hypothetical protein